MTRPANIAILTFPRCQVLDVTGPAMVFEAGNDALGAQPYKVHILSAGGGAVQTSSAVALMTRALRDLPAKSVDTLLIAGGDEAGLPLGVALHVTKAGQILANPLLNKVLGVIVNVGRSVPFIILLVAIIIDGVLNPRDEQTAQQGDI